VENKRRKNINNTICGDKFEIENKIEDEIEEPESEELDDDSEQ
jgi:hypothetical protein